MNINRITDRVTYCGVNDRTTGRFEGLWELPYGVSYNSYVVRGSKASAIIDGSDLHHTAEFIGHLADILEGTTPDYLVINHMEPDHSGAIPTLKSRFPDLKIVGNAKTLDMLNGFYGINTGTVEVKEGDTLDLGDLHLKFILTPMLHWPETMFTYAVEEHVLFTGDALGCFGALNGAVIDRQMDTSLYFPEAYRYYSCIVAKYGQFVEKAFAKIAGLTVDYICTTHGPVWNEQREQIARLYARMAKWEGDRGVVIAYGSMYGTTAAIAEEIGSRLAEAGIKDIRIHDLSHAPQSRVLADIMRLKGLVVISPTYNGEIFPPVASLATALLARGIKNRVIGVAGSYSWGAQSVKKLKAMFEGKPVTLIAPAPEMKQARKEEVSPVIDSLAAELVAALG